MLNRPYSPETFQLSPIKAIELAAVKIPGCISLAQGIPSFQTPEAIRQFVKEKIDAGACDKYSLTTGLLELREEISLALAADKLKYNPDSEIIITAGSIEGITAAVLSCTEAGDEVLLPSPTYTSYRGAIHLARCTPRFVELDEEQNFDFDVEKLEQAISRKTKAILYSSPNNPTGTLFSEEKTRRIVELALKHDITIIVDEVYKDFYYTLDKHFSPTQIEAARKHVIRVCSFSKAFAMTGWRVGFVHSDQTRIKQMLKFHDAMVTCAPVVSQYGALAALRFGAPYLEDFKRQFKERRDFTMQVLDQLSEFVDYQVPKAAYFAFPRIKDTVPLARNSHALAYDILEKARVALVPGSAFGPSGESHLRITFGREKADLEEGMSRFAEYLSGTRQNRAASHAKAALPRTPEPLRRKVAHAALSIGAKIRLLRGQPTIVGIVGTTGKTVVKRHIADLLSRNFPVRSSILSYNTASGLPLSVLGVKSPRSRDELPRFALDFVSKTFFEPEAAKFLVLEYGFGSKNEIAALLSIAVPDWLIVNDATSEDPNSDNSQLREAMSYLFSRVARQRIIWNAEDEWLAAQSLAPELAARLQNSDSDASGSGRPRGSSFEFANNSGILLSQALGPVS